MNKEIDSALCALTRNIAVFYIMWFVFSILIRMIEQGGTTYVEEEWLAGFMTAVLAIPLSVEFQKHI